MVMIEEYEDAVCWLDVLKEISRLETALDRVKTTQDDHTETLRRLETTQNEHTAMLNHQSKTLDCIEVLVDKIVIKHVNGFSHEAIKH